MPLLHEATMHLLLADKTDTLFFNVDAIVGENGVNRREDVLLVQYFLKKVATRLAGQQPITQIIQKIQVSGTMDRATIDAIRAFQEDSRRLSPATVVDGRVSVARGFSYGGGSWTIALLNQILKANFPNLWPRIQDFSDCPAEIKARVAEL